jgi:membrane protease YdiL (CAAX protease family)
MPYTFSLMAIILGYQWVVDPFVDVRGVWRQAPTVLVLAVVIAHNLRTREWGFSGRAFLPALTWTAIVTAPLALAFWIIGHAMGPAPERPQPWLDFLYVIVWGGAQQLVLQTVVLREAQRVAPRAAVLVAAAIFAALHLPNPFLMTVTAIGGLAWCWIYARHPNIVPLAISHAACTVVVLMSFDPRITGGLRTGAAFLRD